MLSQTVPNTAGLWRFAREVFWRTVRMNLVVAPLVALPAWLGYQAATPAPPSPLGVLALWLCVGLMGAGMVAGFALVDAWETRLARGRAVA